jgi:hypothetical protein
MTSTAHTTPQTEVERLRALWWEAVERSLAGDRAACKEAVRLFRLYLAAKEGVT